MWQRPSRAVRWQAVIGVIGDADPHALTPTDNEGNPIDPTNLIFEITTLVVQNKSQDTNTEINVLSSGSDSVIARLFGQQKGSGAGPTIEPGLCTKKGEVPGIQLSAAGSVVGFATGYAW